ncbi:hypothetical protein ACFWVF_07420 [Streptomyces sp. NPDC058659]|uniref:hypothetical protein n=1 Tax=unclassified Streptomyces TaxID=2593676 RepID=UPI0036560117
MTVAYGVDAPHGHRCGSGAVDGRAAVQPSPDWTAADTTQHGEHPTGVGPYDTPQPREAAPAPPARREHDHPAGTAHVTGTTTRLSGVRHYLAGNRPLPGRAACS